MDGIKKTALIIGAGPAGLTAAYQLLKETDILPVIIEESDFIGGISRTVVQTETEWISADTGFSQKTTEL
jgi:protoporphyrinogen oxidase